MDENTALGLRAELDHLVRPDWKIVREPDAFRIIAPHSTLPLKDRTAELQNEAWRIAQFIAYSHFVSISKTAGDDFIIISRMASGNGFEVRLEHSQQIQFE